MCDRRRCRRESVLRCAVYTYTVIYIFIYTRNSARGRVDGGEGFSILLRVNNGFYTAAATAALGERVCKRPDSWSGGARILRDVCMRV